MSAYTKQLRDAQNDLGIKGVSQVCNNTDQFIYQINAVTRILLKLGDWFDTVQYGKFCFCGSHIVFPRFVGTVQSARFCGADSTDIKNKWYHIFGRFRGKCWDNTVAMTDDGMAPTHNEVSGNTGKYIRYYVVHPQDLNKNITLFGTKYGNQPLQEKIDGVWQNGVTITSQTPIAQTSQLVTSITSIVREATQGMAYLYEYDPNTGLMRDLAVFEPGDTHPRFRRMKVNNLGTVPCTTNENGQSVRTVDVIYKLNFVEVVNPWDFLIISDFDALRLGIQAYDLEKNNDDAGAEVKWNKAIRELNFESRNKNPDDQFTVHVNYMGANVCIRNPI